jgi:hypothetical protein
MKSWHNIHTEFYQNTSAGLKVTTGQSEAHIGLIQQMEGSHMHIMNYNLLGKQSHKHNELPRYLGGQSHAQNKYVSYWEGQPHM